MKDYQKVEEMKLEYEQIPIPEELKGKVQDSLNQAKRKEQRKHQFHKALKRTAISAAAAAAALVLLVNFSSEAAAAMERLPVIGGIVRVVTFREYFDSRDRSRAEIKVPKADADGAGEGMTEMNQQIEEYTNQIIAQYEEEVKWIEGLEHTEDSASAKYEVSTDYEIATDNDALFSIRINTFVAMAGTNSYIKIYHVDKQSGRIITLKDLFEEGADYITPISEEIKAQMQERMAQDKNQYYWLNDEMEEMNFKQITPEANFYVNQDGKLTLVFDKYEVAPGYMGVVEFTIPTEKLDSIVKYGYLK